MRLDTQDRRAPVQPRRWKGAVLSFVGLYPLVTAATTGTARWLPRLPVPVRTLLIIGVVVPTMTYVVGPALHRLANRWLAD